MSILCVDNFHNGIPIWKWGSLYQNGDLDITILIQERVSHLPVLKWAPFQFGIFNPSPRFGMILNWGPSFKIAIPIWLWIGRLQNSKLGSPRIGLGVFYYRKTRCISKTFIKQHAKIMKCKLSFEHITPIPTTAAHLSVIAGCGSKRAFRPYVVLWGFDHLP